VRVGVYVLSDVGLHYKACSGVHAERCIVRQKEKY